MPIKDTSWTDLIRQTAYDSYGGAPSWGSKYKFRGATLKLVRTRTGEAKPRWKELIAAHQNATTYMTATYDSVYVKSGFMRINYQYLYDGVNRTNRDSYVRGDFNFSLHSGPLGGAWTADAEKLARIKFMRAVKDAQRSFGGGQFFGELRETLRMISGRGKQLYGKANEWMDYATSAAHRHRIHAKRAKEAAAAKRRRKTLPPDARKRLIEYERDLKAFTKEIANTWLEKSFGWDPLFHDIEDARTALDEVLETERLIKVNAGGRAAKLVGHTTYQVGPLVVGTQIYCMETLVDKETAIYRYRGAVKAQAQTTWKDRAARFGFSASDFVPTAWELLPWSFLADYFANIGDCLEAAFTDTSSLAWLAGTSILQRDRLFYTQLDVPRVQTVIGGARYLNFSENNPAMRIWRRRNVTRTPSISGLEPFGLFMLKFPGFDDKPRQWLNMAALLTQGLSIHPQNRIRPYTRKWYIR